MFVVMAVVLTIVTTPSPSGSTRQSIEVGTRLRPWLMGKTVRLGHLLIPTAKTDP